LIDADDVYDTDVLVLGGGGAGARAAVEAKNRNLQVTVVVKGLFGKSGCTPMAEGGYAAAIGHAEPADNPKIHFKDTVTGGSFLNDQQLVRVLVDEAPGRLFDLELFGAIFDRTEDGRFVQNRPGGHTYHRGCQHGDRTGHEIMVALRREVARRGIETLEEVMATRLLVSGGAVAGAAGIRISDGGFVVFKAKSTVLATGGLGQLYSFTTNPSHETGDGYAMAYEAGAELIDMEMVQFHPTGLAYPPSARGILVTEACRSRGGVLYNRFGDRFMKQYDPVRMELSTRDVVSRAVYSEVLGGRGTEHSGVYLDVSHIPDEEVERYLPSVLEKCSSYGFNIREEPVEVTPTCHHHMGGLVINERCQTTLAYLYACGECSASVHGANRLGTNAVAETQVFGARAGRFAAEDALRRETPALDADQLNAEHERIRSILERREGIRPGALKTRVQDLMWRKVGIIRDERGLLQALTELDRVRREDIPRLMISESHPRYSYDLVEALEADNMVIVAELVAKAALMRRESRGAHFRQDYPKQDDMNWLKHTSVRLEGERSILTTRAVVLSELLPGEA